MIWHTLKDADGSGVVVDTSCGAKSGREDGGGGDQVVGKGVVQVALGGEGCSVSLVVEVGGRRGRGGDVIPGARKHPGRCRIPSRTCPRAMPVRILVSSFLWGGSCRPGQRADMLKHHVMASASWPIVLGASRFPSTYGTLPFMGSHIPHPAVDSVLSDPVGKRLTGQKIPQTSPPRARSAGGSRC